MAGVIHSAGTLCGRAIRTVRGVELKPAVLPAAPDSVTLLLFVQIYVLFLVTDHVYVCRAVSRRRAPGKHRSQGVWGSGIWCLLLIHEATSRRVHGAARARRLASHFAGRHTRRMQESAHGSVCIYLFILQCSSSSATHAATPPHTSSFMVVPNVRLRAGKLQRKAAPRCAWRR